MAILKLYFVVYFILSSKNKIFKIILFKRIFSQVYRAFLKSQLIIKVRTFQNAGPGTRFFFLKIAPGPVFPDKTGKTG